MEAAGLGALKSKIKALSHKVKVLNTVYYPVCMIHSSTVTQKILGETCLTQTLDLDLETKLCLAQTFLGVAVLPGEFSECLVTVKYILLTWLSTLIAAIAFVPNSPSTRY